MSDVESRSLMRAAVALLIVSLLRWGGAWVQDRGAGESAVGPASVLDSLSASTDRVAEEAQRRARPLGEGERIDPNTAAAGDLDRLPGVGPSTAAAIVAARDSLVFRRPEDLIAVRGVGEVLVSRIAAHLDLSAPPAGPPAARVQRAPIAPRGRPAFGPAAGAGPAVDLNRADATQLQALPGIGPALAGRIVAARQERPFSDVDDLVRVTGIGPSTVDRLRSLVRVSLGR